MTKILSYFMIATPPWSITGEIPKWFEEMDGIKSALMFGCPSKEPDATIGCKVPSATWTTWQEEVFVNSCLSLTNVELAPLSRMAEGW